MCIVTRIVVVTAASLTLVFAPTGSPNDSVARVVERPNVTVVSVRSSYATEQRLVSRDGGISTELPDGHDLWLFGDTGVYRAARNGRWAMLRFIDGSTAMLTRTVRGQVPSGREIPAGVPERFIPVPRDAFLPDGSGRPCNPRTAAFAARWPTGVAVLTNHNIEVLVTYSIVCVTVRRGVPQVRTEGWGYLMYNWKTQHIDHGPADVQRPRRSGAALPASKLYGSPQVVNGKVTFFASHCTVRRSIGCAHGHVWVVTVTATTRALDDMTSYRSKRIVTDSSGRWRPLSISVGSYGEGLRLVETVSILGEYRIFSAPTVGARWHLTGFGFLPGCPTRKGFCIALQGHPELSTSTATFVSYRDPDAGPGAPIVVSALANIPAASVWRDASRAGSL